MRSRSTCVWKKHRARGELAVSERRRVGGAAFVGDDAGERRLDVLGDVAGIDRAHPLPVARRKRDVLERTEGDRGARQERGARGGRALVGLAVRAEVLLIEAALIAGRVRRGRVRDILAPRTGC